MAVTGVDTNLPLRGKFAIISIVKYAIDKLRDGDHKAHDKYIEIAERISNLVYALESDEIEDAEDDTVYCFNAILFKLIQDVSDVPGIVPPTTVGEGIGSMVISVGFGNLFIVT